METSTNGIRNKLPSNDSLDEDTLSDDVDDEVFIKSARNGFRNSNKDKTLQKPLMAPRKKTEREKKLGAQNGRSNGVHLMEIHTASPKGSPFLITILYVTIALGAVTGLTGLVIFLAKSHLSNFVQRVSIWKPTKSGVPFAEPCDSFVEEAVWEVNIPHAISQGQKVLTSVDINKDSIEDIIIGFDSGLNGVTPLTSFLCRLYFNTSSTVCDGGLVAVNGSNGAILWTTWLDDAVYAVNCLADLDLDGIIDCTVTGKSRALWAVSSKDGKQLWGIATDKLQLPCLAESNFRSAQIVEDVSGDKVADVVVGIRGSQVKCPDYIAIVNGYTGNVLQLTGIPDQGSLSLGPLLKGSGDGSTLVLYSTKGTNGSLFMASLKDIASGRKDLVRTVLSNVSRIDEIVVSDITSDGMEDFIVTMDNGTAGGKDVVALNGNGFHCLWIHTVSAGTTLKIQALANLNEDELPDVAIQMTLTSGSANTTWIRVLDGSNGKVVMNLPARLRRWDVHGESLAVEGTAADVILDWIGDDEDETAQIQINRLMGFSSQGELPALVVYSTPGATPSKTTGYAAESSLRDILDVVSQDDDLRAKFSNYIQHTESERSSDAIRVTEEMEPNVIVYPAQHGIRKHGRWNSRPRHEEGFQAPVPASYDYDPPTVADLMPPPDPVVAVPVGIESRYRKTGQRPATATWKDQQDLEEDSAYVSSGNSNDYVDTAGSSSSADADYDLASRDYSRYRQRPSRPQPWRPERNGGRRGKRIRRQGSSTPSNSQPTESIGFPPLVVSAGSSGYTDLVFGVQWSWTESGERVEQLQGLADCVSRRLDQGRELNDDVVVDYASECAAAQSLAGSSPVSADEPKSTGDIKLVASAVGEWLRPLARRRHGWVALKRVRLECSCHSAGSKGSPSSPKSGPIIKPCANLRPPSQRRKVDFHYYH
ncbi:uncharacterized protein LOC124316141 [Daphnia pulicaria]|uniref:uncharacterized protein LOC124316141 n=1 Tax=Daphnia pulicaria TaxID=35523 RepID=UPI001EEAD9EB|nr:uncharacterized protein LOC124316141 [Daphnia pulicaria]